MYWTFFEFFSKLFLCGTFFLRIFSSVRKKNEKIFWDMEIIGNRRKISFFLQTQRKVFLFFAHVSKHQHLATPPSPPTILFADVILEWSLFLIQNLSLFLQVSFIHNLKSVYLGYLPNTLKTHQLTSCLYFLARFSGYF